MFVVDVVGVLERCDEGLVCCDESSAEKSENNFKCWNVLIRGTNSTHGECGKNVTVSQGALDELCFWRATDCWGLRVGETL
jgi:hypothetical protein